MKKIPHEYDFGNNNNIDYKFSVIFIGDSTAKTSIW